MGLMAGVEIGGTFTDLVLIRDGEIVQVVKVPSTPASPADAALNALSQLDVPLSDLSLIVHGSTVATNAVLERKGARTALIATAGFGDMLEIQHEEREKVYNLRHKKPRPLVSRDLVLEAEERIGADGEVIVPLDVEPLLKELDDLVRRENIRSVAICLLHSYVSPKHEQELAGLIRKRYPDLHLTSSSETLPEFREYNRVSTTVVSAFVTPKVADYLSGMQQKIVEEEFKGELLVMQSNGGISPVEAVRDNGAWMLLSGPAAGAVAGARIAQVAGFQKAISLDMGGTSADVCLSEDAQPSFTTNTKIGGFPVRLPMVDIVTIGAGGGSIANFDVGGMLRVGPESAGADPGPACYGRGGKLATVTDANAVLGLLAPDAFLGGKMRLSVESSKEVLTEVGRGMGGGPEVAAEAVRRVVNANMAQAVRLVSVERGYDPRDFVLVGFGGAGPLHAVELAEELEIASVLIPEFPGLLSAHGLLVADFRRDYMRTSLVRLAAASVAELREVFQELEGQGAQDAAGHTSLNKASVTGLYLDMRYRGQAYEIRVPIERSELEQGDDLKWLQDKFDAAHLHRYGHASVGSEVEIVTFRLSFGAPGASQLGGKSEAAGQSNQRAISTERQIYYGGEWRKADFWKRDSLSVGFQFVGPAIVEEVSATTFIPPNWKVEVLSNCALLVTRAD